MRWLWAMWFGPPPVGARLAAAKTLENTGVPVRWLNNSNWLDVEKPEYPFPRALLLPGLSQNHRADYLRAYVMHNYGGGYSDVKPTDSSWVKAFDELNDENGWLVGVQETRGGVACSNGVAEVNCEKLGKSYEHLATNGAYIMRPHTPLTFAWLHEATRRLKKRGPEIMKHPAHRPRCCQGENPNNYPVRWAELHGEILHPLMWVYRQHLKLTLPRWSDGPYRGVE